MLIGKHQSLIEEFNRGGFMVSGISNIGQTSTTSTLEDRNSIGSKDQFLKLLLAQIEQQDPLKTTDASQLADQITQFGQLEQLMNINSTVEQLVSLQTSTDRTQAVSLIGTSVDVYGDEVEVQGESNGQIAFELGKAAHEVKVDLYNDSNELVRSISYQDQSAGLHAFDFDGETSGGADLPDGIYRMSVSAVDADGAPIDSKAVMHGQVTGVEFLSGGTVVKLGGKSFTMDQILTVSGLS